MLVALNQPEAHWEAIQASLRLRRAHKRMNRLVIQALIRERLELAVEQAAEFWRSPERFEAGREFLFGWMSAQLAGLDLELERLDLMGVPRFPTAAPADGLVPRYQECWLDKIPSADGFEIDLAVVVRSWVPPLLLGIAESYLEDRLRHSARLFFSELDAETGLARIAAWQATLGPDLQWFSDTWREVTRLMRATQGVTWSDARICADRSWVTRRQLRPGPRAFQPGQRYGFLDAYQLFFMLKDRRLMQRHYGPS